MVNSFDLLHKNGTRKQTKIRTPTVSTVTAVLRAVLRGPVLVLCAADVSAIGRAIAEGVAACTKLGAWVALERLAASICGILDERAAIRHGSDAATSAGET